MHNKNTIIVNAAGGFPAECYQRLIKQLATQNHELHVIDFNDLFAPETAAASRDRLELYTQLRAQWQKLDTQGLKAIWKSVKQLSSPGRSTPRSLPTCP